MAVIDSQGRTVSHDQAMVGGTLGLGFREVLEDGECVHFDLVSMRDHASGSGSRVF